MRIECRRLLQLLKNLDEQASSGMRNLTMEPVEERLHLMSACANLVWLRSGKSESVATCKILYDAAGLRTRRENNELEFKRQKRM